MAQKVLGRTLTVAAETQIKAQAKMADRLGQLLYAPMTLDQVENVLRTAVEALILVYHTPFTTPPSAITATTAPQPGLEAQESMRHPPTVSVAAATVAEEEEEAEEESESEAKGRTPDVIDGEQQQQIGRTEMGGAEGETVETAEVKAVVVEERGETSGRPLMMDEELAIGLDNVVRSMPLYEKMAAEASEQLARLERQLVDVRDHIDDMQPFLERFPKLEAAVRHVKRHADMWERESSMRRHKGPTDEDIAAQLETLRTDVQRLQDKVSSLEHRHDESTCLAKERVKKVASDVQDMGPKLAKALEALQTLQSESRDASKDIITLKESAEMVEALAKSVKRGEGADPAAMQRVRELDTRLAHLEASTADDQRAAQSQHDSMLLRVNKTANTVRELWENVEKDGEDVAESLSQMTARVDELDRRMQALPSVSDLEQNISLMVGKLKEGLEEEAEKRSLESQSALEDMRSQVSSDVDRLWTHVDTQHTDILCQHNSCNDKVNKILLPAVANLQDELRTLFSLKAETRDLWDEMKRIRTESDDLPNTLRGELSPAVEKSVLMSIEHRLASLDNARVAYMRGMQGPLRPDDLSAIPPMLTTASRVAVKCLSCDHTAYVAARGSLENCRCGIPLPPPLLPGSQSLPTVTSPFPPSSNQAAHSLFRHEIERRNVSSRGQRVAVLRQRHEKVLGTSTLKGGAPAPTASSIQREFPAGEERQEATTLFSQLTKAPLQRPHTAPYSRMPLVVSIPDIRVQNAIEKL